MSQAVDRQQNYYRDTAESYAEDHLAPGDEHYVALEYSLGLVDTLRATSVLDVGAGTGRAVDFLRRERPAVRVVGLEPVDALREQAERNGGTYVGGSGERLPFADGEFDVVMATAVMHHVRHPEVVVAEMMRVASRAVLISDVNRFGQGRWWARLLKLAVHRAGLWPVIDVLRTRGRMYRESEGDGVFYSYSIYDSLPTLSSWGSRVFVVPTKGTYSSTTGALLGSSHGLLVAAREPESGWAGL